MKILLPYPNFSLSAKVMHTADLFDTLHDIETALSVLHQTDEAAADTLWEDSCIQAWRGHEAQLAEYGLTILDEARTRVYTLETVCKECFFEMKGHQESLTHHQLAAESGGLAHPDWMGNTNLHTSHKSELLRSHPDFYSKLFEFVRADIPVQWMPEADAS